MHALLVFFVLFSFLFASFFISWSSKYTLTVITAVWTYVTIIGFVSLPVMIVGWFVWLPALLMLWIKPLRLKIFSAPLCEWFQTKLPAISADEKMVLETGGSWWESEIFSGKPKLSNILNQRIGGLTAVERSFLDQQVNTLCEMLNEWEINNKYKDLPKQAWDYIKSERFWALCMDKSYGGLGFSHLAHSAIITKIASRSICAAYTVMVPNSLGPAELINYCGTKEQKEYYLPRLADGREIGCFGLTSLHAGSDAASIPDQGVICRGMHDGVEVLGIRLDFKKRYITLAPVSTLIGLAFQLSDPDSLIGEDEKLGITVALVPSHHQGVAVGTRHSPMTLGFMNGPLSGENVFIPIDWVIGGQENCGQGWKILMGCLSIGRGISMPALSSAVAQQCTRMTGPYAAIRRQFKKAIGEFEGVKEKLAHIAGRAYLIESMRYCISQAVEDGARPSVAAAISKFHLTELSRAVLKDAMDIHSGHGLQAGPSNLLAEIYSGIPISTVGEGANIMTRNLIIFGQGVMRSHPFIRDSISAAADVEHNPLALDLFDQAISQHVRWSVKSWVRGFIFGVTKGRCIRVKKHPLAYAQKRIIWLSNAFASISDIALLKLGKSFKQKETMSSRLGDVLSYLTLATCVLKYCHDHLKDHADDELAYARWAFDYCFYQIEQALNGFFDNFAYRRWAKVLRAVFFPLGLRFHYPSDTLNHTLANSLQVNNSLHQRLSSLCFVGSSVSDPVRRIDHAWQTLQASQALFDKVQRAVKQKRVARQWTREETFNIALKQKVITQVEYDTLIDAEKIRDYALNVDEFAFHDLVRFNANMGNPAEID
jgi:acyl-CoA dehydrogenase